MAIALSNRIKRLFILKESPCDSGKSSLLSIKRGAAIFAEDAKLASSSPSVPEMILGPVKSKSPSPGVAVVARIGDPAPVSRTIAESRAPNVVVPAVPPPESFDSRVIGESCIAFLTITLIPTFDIMSSVVPEPRALPIFKRSDPPVPVCPQQRRGKEQKSRIVGRRNRSILGKKETLFMSY
ncbi:MAG: hypothetical protein ACRC10_02215 [Thermoguttaceae bacterium]